jgi:hypothetical protein
MDVLDLFFKKYAYKFPKGYPDMNSEQDIKLLANLLENVGIDLQEKEQMSFDFPEENKDSSIFGKIIYDTFDGNIPPVKGIYKFDGDFKISSEDQDSFNKLYNIIPSQNVGKGELALYWLFNYKDPNTPSKTLTKNSNVGGADFTINGKNIEVKAYKSLNSKITLGKFKEDTQSRELINNIFGLINLNNLTGDSDKKSVSEINFTAESLSSNFSQLLELSKISSEKNDIIEEFPLLKQINNLLTEIFKTTTDPEQLTKNTLISLTITKLNKKPGLGNYIANSPPNSTQVEVILIPENAEDILRDKSFEEINKTISVSSAEIQFNYSIFR